MGEAEQAAQPLYPPQRHMARDLGLWIERGEGRLRAGMEVVPQTCSDAGSVRAGVLATLVDVVGGEGSLRAVAPDWVATADLVLDCLRPVREGLVTAHATLLRAGRSQVVLEVELRSEAWPDEPVGLATMSFARMAARGEVQRMGLGKSAPRTEFALPDSGLRCPFPASLGVQVLDADAGVLELPVVSYVHNSLGGLQGGAVASLVELAAEAAGRAASGEPWVTTDMAIRFLALGKVGPVRSQARVLRLDRASALLRVELHDSGAGDRLMTVATATVEPF